MPIPLFLMFKFKLWEQVCALTYLCSDGKGVFSFIVLARIQVKGDGKYLTSPHKQTLWFAEVSVVVFMVDCMVEVHAIYIQNSYGMKPEKNTTLSLTL